MPTLDHEKALAAAAAVSEVKSGMLVGLGTGSTAAHAVREIGKRMAVGLTIRATATSLATEALARSLNIPLVPLNDLSSLDLCIDGADEIDPQLNAIKGGGGALLREKIVASAAKRMIVIADSSKFVQRLGKFKLPLEVLPFAAAWVERAVADLGARVSQRRKPDSSPALTDQGNLLFDADFGEISDPQPLARALDSIPGLVEHGLFLSEVDAAYIARGMNVDFVARK